MDLVNDTPLPSALVPTSSGDGEILLLALSALTLDLSSGRAALAPVQEPLKLAPDKVYPNDAQLLREGVAVCATGHVYAARSGAGEGRATLAIGDLRRDVLAFGARVWRAGTFGGAPAPTAPRPFERIAMRWENAFGGSAAQEAMSVEKDGETLIVPGFERHAIMNPLGKGFYLKEKDCIDRPLPELEHPDHRITAWDQQPEPVCFAPYPLFGGLRVAGMLDGQKVNLNRLTKVTGKSAPRTTFPAIPAGTEVSLAGMRPGGKRLAFSVPRSPVDLHVSIGGVEKKVTPYLDAIDIDADNEQVRFLFRAGFRYPLIAGEVRRATVAPSDHFPGPAGA